MMDDIIRDLLDANDILVQVGSKLEKLEQDHIIKAAKDLAYMAAAASEEAYTWLKTLETKDIKS